MTERAVQQRPQQPDNVTYLSRSCAASFSHHDGPNPSTWDFGSASARPTLPRFVGGLQRSNWKSKLSRLWILATARIRIYFIERELSSLKSKALKRIWANEEFCRQQAELRARRQPPEDVTYFEYDGR
jgi:hypothetical protein